MSRHTTLVYRGVSIPLSRVVFFYGMPLLIALLVAFKAVEIVAPSALPKAGGMVVGLVCAINASWWLWLWRQDKARTRKS